MYQHPAALDLNASHYQREALNEAKLRRLAHEARDAEQSGHTADSLGGASLQRRMVAVAMALVTVLGIAVLVI
jgi:hypothetical protein